MDKLQDRIAELETRIAFQDDTIQALNDVVVQQRNQIDSLETRFNTLQQQVKNLAPSLIAHPSEETPPPHY
jgi:SlyX protein